MIPVPDNNIARIQNPAQQNGIQHASNQRHINTTCSLRLPRWSGQLSPVLASPADCSSTDRDYDLRHMQTASLITVKTQLLRYSRHMGASSSGVEQLCRYR